MNQYYFLGTLLPTLTIDEPPEIGFDELDQLFRENLTNVDYGKTKVIRNLFDIINLRAYWKGEPLDEYGNFSNNELEESLATRSMLPQYVFDYIDKYSSKEALIKNFPELLAIFFRTAINNSTGFFKDYFSLERELRLVLAAFRAKKLGKDIYREFQYENPEEDLIAQILAQKDSLNYEPPEKYHEIKTLFERYYDDPIELQKSLLEYRFNKIEEKIGIQLFTMDRILAYMVKLILIERWQHLDEQKGKEMIDSMLKESL